MSARVAILLGVHGPAPYLTEQLESLAAQTHEDWGLVISFDGACVAARSQVAAFAARYPDHDLRLLQGPNAGFVANYLFLLQNVPPEADFISFCDHDDVWLADKIEANLRHVAGRTGAAITVGRTIICSEALEPFASGTDLPYPPHFGNALLQSLGAGNTMMFNREALEVLLWAAPHGQEAVAHDWWAYQVLTGMGAQVIYDREPRVLYRQHAGNLFGTNVTFRARVFRIGQVFQGRLREWAGRSITCLWPLRARFTPEARKSLERFAEAREAGLFRRVRLMRQAGVFRQTPAERILFWLAVLMGKI